MTKKNFSAMFLVLLFGCTDAVTVPGTVEPKAGQLQQGPIPTRAQEAPHSLVAQPDGNVWKSIAVGGRVPLGTRRGIAIRSDAGVALNSASTGAIEGQDNLAVIGVRAPGAPRGSWHGKLLLTPAEFQAALEGLKTVPGLTLFRADTLVAAVFVKIDNLESLQSIRALPYVDYVESAYLKRLGSGWASGCGGDDGDPVPAALLYNNGGDYHQSNWTSVFGMAVLQTWGRGVNGHGVTLGLVDTGVSDDQPELRANFATGEVTDRWVQHHRGTGEAATCNHGTRMASVMAAPRNGHDAVGIAYGANLFTYRDGDDYFFMSGFDVGFGIDAAGNAGAKVIALAMQVDGDGSEFVKDKIRYWYYNADMLFIGAAGTGAPINYVVFPASMDEVVAVTGTEPDNYSEHCGSCFYGSKVMLAAPTHQVANGLHSGYLMTLDGSSAATAVVAAVAGLVYSKYPTANRNFVLNRLVNSGSLYPNWNNDVGYGVVSAVEAATDPEPPYAPQNVNVINRSSDYAAPQLSWGAAEDFHYYPSYNIYRMNPSNGAWIQVAWSVTDLTWTETDPSVRVSTGSCSLTAVYMVRAQNLAGEGPGGSTGVCRH